MPVLSLQAVPERKPGDVSAGVFPEHTAGAEMTYAVDETLPVERKHQP
jgi:hypothetical protein